MEHEDIPPMKDIIGKIARCGKPPDKLIGAIENARLAFPSIPL